MKRTLRSLSLVALASITFITLAHGTSTIRATVQSPASTLSTMEIDVIFPVHNATYNITESLPIVFALQNLTAAAASGSFNFLWDIMPWGDVGGPPEPGGVVNDYWKTTFTTTNTSSEPYILVNQTNVQQWRFGPQYYRGSVYALQWYLSWDAPNGPCDSDRFAPKGTHLFNINIDSPEPDLKDLIGQCSQLSGAYDINTAAKNSSCSAVVSSSSGDPCAVTLDQAMVGNISSAVHVLISASAAASSASSALATPTSTLSPARHNDAVSSEMPSRYLLVATLFASLQMVGSL